MRMCDDCRERKATETVDFEDLDPLMWPEYLCQECAERAEAWLKARLAEKEEKR